MGSSLVARLAPLLPILLVLAALACFTVAAFSLAFWVGWVTLGVGALAVEYVLGERGATR